MTFCAFKCALAFPVDPVSYSITSAPNAAVGGVGGGVVMVVVGGGCTENQGSGGLLLCLLEPFRATVHMRGAR